MFLLGLVSVLAAYVLLIFNLLGFFLNNTAAALGGELRARQAATGSFFHRLSPFPRK